MEKINTIVKSNIPPRDTNVVWLNTEDGSINVFDPQEGWKATAGGAGNVKKVTYKELVEMEHSGTLVPRQQYRITDYVTMVNPELTELQSDERPFDIIVTAGGNYWLYPNAKATNHEFDAQKQNIKYFLVADTRGPGRITYRIYQRFPQLDISDTEYSKAWIMAWSGFEFPDQDTLENSADWYSNISDLPIGYDEGYSNTEDPSELSDIQFPTMHVGTIRSFVETNSIEVETVKDPFEYSDLSDWKLLYTTSNSYYNWGKQDEGGKGIILYMQDEFGNEAQFDFKNIKFDSGYIQEEFEPTGEYYHLFTDGTELGDTSLYGASYSNNIIDGSRDSILKPATLSDVWETIYNSENYALIGYNATVQAQMKELSDALSALTDRVAALEQAANP